MERIKELYRSDNGRPTHDPKDPDWDAGLSGEIQNLTDQNTIDNVKYNLQYQYVAVLNLR
jgi:hypothetical protein